MNSMETIGLIDDWFDVIILFMVYMILNLSVVELYLDKRTRCKHIFAYETNKIQRSMVFFAIFWVFFQSKLREIRKFSEIERRYNCLVISDHMMSEFGGLKDEELKEFNALKRILKLARIKKKMKKRVR